MEAPAAAMFLESRRGGLFFFFHLKPGNFKPTFCISCTCSYAAFGAYAHIHSRYKYLKSLSNIQTTACICKPANVLGYISTGVNLLLVLICLYKCHLCKARAHNSMTSQKEKSGCQEKLTLCLVSVKQLNWLSHLRLR